MTYTKIGSVVTWHDDTTTGSSFDCCDTGVGIIEEIKWNGEYYTCKVRILTQDDRPHAWMPAFELTNIPELRGVE